MSKLLENKASKYGIILGFSLYLLVQIISFIDYVVSINNFENPQGVNIDMIWSFGLPIPMFYGQYNSPNSFIWWRGIIANLLITIIFSFAVGLIFKFVGEKFTAKRLR